MKLFKQFHSVSAPYTWLKPGANERASNQSLCKSEGLDLINTRLQSGVLNAGSGSRFNGFRIDKLQ